MSQHRRAQFLIYFLSASSSTDALNITAITSVALAARTLAALAHDGGGADPLSRCFLVLPTLGSITTSAALGGIITSASPGCIATASLACDHLALALINLSSLLTANEENLAVGLAWSLLRQMHCLRMVLFPMITSCGQ